MCKCSDNREERQSLPLLHHNASNDHLSILYFNALSIIPKLDELKAIVEAEQPLVCIVETWLSADISNNEIAYQSLRADRNRQGGGVLMYVVDSLSPASLLSAPFDLALLLVSISPCSPSHGKFCIGVF